MWWGSEKQSRGVSLIQERNSEGVAMGLGRAGQMAGVGRGGGRGKELSMVVNSYYSLIGRRGLERGRSSQVSGLGNWVDCQNISNC